MSFAPGHRDFSVLLALLAAVALPVFVTTTVCAQQLNDQDIVFSEFFKEIFVVDRTNGLTEDILDSNPFDSPFGQLVEAVASNRIIISGFGDLYEYVNQTTTRLVVSIPGSISVMTRDGNGGLFVGDSRGLYSVDLDTGEVEAVFEELFFPRDIVASDDGLIYSTHARDVLSVINPTNGTSRKIGSFGFGESGFEEFGRVRFQHIDIGPDGLLYVATSDEFFQVNPLSGDAQLLPTTGVSSIDGLGVDRDGQLVFAGEFSGTIGVFSLNPLTGGVTTLLDAATIDDTFFSIQDMTIWEPGLRTALAIPEPTGLVPMLVFLGACAIRRHRELG